MSVALFCWLWLGIVILVFAAYFLDCAIGGSLMGWKNRLFGEMRDFSSKLWNLKGVLRDINHRLDMMDISLDGLRTSYQEERAARQACLPGTKKKHCPCCGSEIKKK